MDPSSFWFPKNWENQNGKFLFLCCSFDFSFGFFEIMFLVLKACCLALLLTMLQHFCFSLHLAAIRNSLALEKARFWAWQPQQAGKQMALEKAKEEEGPGILQSLMLAVAWCTNRRHWKTWGPMNMPAKTIHHIPKAWWKHCHCGKGCWSWRALVKSTPSLSGLPW